MAGAWKEIVDSSFTVNGKALNKDGISIEKEDITGLTGILTGIDGDITSKVDKTAKIGTTAIGSGIATLDTTAIPSLAISKITGLQTNLDAKVPSTFKIGDQVLTGTGITLLEATIPTLGQAKITGLVTDLASKVPTSRKIAGKALTADITLAKGDVGLGNVDNKSSATIRGEITVDNIPIDIPQSKIKDLPGLSNTVGIHEGDISTLIGRKINGFTLKADITLETQDLIPEKTTLPTTGVNGQIVKQGNQLFIWKESAV